jgi:hypothetical protein
VTDTNAFSARFLRRLGSVSEIQMRVALWRELLTKTHPDESLETLKYVLDAKARGTQDAYPAMLAFSRLLVTDRALVERKILTAAVVSQSHELIELLTEHKARRKMAPEEVRVPLLNTDREVTLGERRTLARGHDRNVLERLLMDPDVGVVKNLLRNPKILERDVLRIASAQPINALALEAVFRNDRWCNRRQVQLALIQNPYTPAVIARALVELLDESALREVSEARGIDPSILATVQSRLKTAESDDDALGQVLDNEWVLNLLERRAEDEPMVESQEDKDGA